MGRVAAWDYVHHSGQRALATVRAIHRSGPDPHLETAAKRPDSDVRKGCEVFDDDL